MSLLTAGNFISALHEDMDRITEIVRDDMEDSNSFVMGKIPDGGDVIHNDQHDSIEYTAAKPSFMGYRDVDAAPRALVPGSMEAQACAGTNKSFATNVNEKDPNACGGLCEFKFGQGYRVYSTADYELPMTTPEVCANHFIRQGSAHVDGYFEGLFESYRKYGMDNFEAELQNRVIQFGEANASIVSANHFQLTKGGFHAPPQSRMTIHFLIEYRNYMEYEMALTPEGYLEIEMPRQDWFDAVTEHQVQKNSMGGNTSFDTTILKDETAELWGRDFHIFENVKCYFNERPVRGYFKPDGNVGGATQHSFVRVFPWINVVNEEGGVSAEPNHGYNAGSTRCDGIKYPMSTLAFHIHNTAFKRFRLKEADKKAGEANVPTNFSMVIRDGAWIPNNKLNDKFLIVSRHAYRLKQWKLERAGAIAYRHSRPEGYIIAATDPEQDVVAEEFASGQKFDKCLPDASEAENCIACDQVVNDNGDCEDTPGAAVINFTPSGGEVFSVNDGTAQDVTIRFERTGTFEGDSTVDYALTVLGGAADGTNVTLATGTITFPDGSIQPQYLDVEILDGAGMDGINDGVLLTISNPGGALTPTLEDTTVSIIIVDAT
jgi:hypothetical protein